MDICSCFVSHTEMCREAEKWHGGGSKYWLKIKIWIGEVELRHAWKKALHSRLMWQWRTLDCYQRCGKQADVSLSHLLAVKANWFFVQRKTEGAAMGVELPAIEKNWCVFSRWVFTYFPFRLCLSTLQCLPRILGSKDDCEDGFSTE